VDAVGLACAEGALRRRSASSSGQPARFRSVTAMLAAVLVAIGTHVFIAAWRHRGLRLWVPLSAPLLGVALFSWVSRTAGGGFGNAYASALVAIGLAAARRQRHGASGRRRWRRAVPAWALVMPALTLTVAVAISRPAHGPSTAPERVVTLLTRERELTELAAAMSFQDRVTSHEDDPPRFSRDDPGPETVLGIA
jgi:hypothetical protein